MDFQNAFTAGLRPGGLTNDFEVQVFVCYLLKHIGIPATFTQLGEIVQTDGMVNYFEFVSAISQLKQGGHLNISQADGGEAYTLTSKGKMTADSFEHLVPLSIREHGLKASAAYFARQRMMEENYTEIIKVPDGYQITLIVSDVGSDLMRLSLFVHKEKQCEAIRKAFMKDPVHVYQSMLSLFQDAVNSEDDAMFI